MSLTLKILKDIERKLKKLESPKHKINGRQYYILCSPAFLKAILNKKR